MSTEEQEIAEQMGDDDDEAADDDEDGEPSDALAEVIERAEKEGTAPRSQKEIDALNRKLEAEADRHSKRVAEIMGEDFSLLIPSPVDWTPGFIFNVPEMHPLPEQVAQLHAILGQPTQIELRPATDAEGCPDCNALGDVLTGSKKQGQEVKPCPACGGTGWKPKMAAVPESGVVSRIGQYTGAATAEPNQFPVADRWGRPSGHPHYGLEPAFVGA